MVRIAIVYHSGYGHTAALAEAVAVGAVEAGAEVSSFRIASPSDDFTLVLEAVQEADAVVLGAPTYMGDISAAMKAFLEASSKPWATLSWKDKLASGFTNSASPSGDKLHALQTLAVAAMQHGMIWVGLGLPPGAANNNDAAPAALNRLGGYFGATAQSDNAPPSETPPEGDRMTARHLGRRVAEAARRWTGLAEPALREVASTRP